MAAKMQVHVRVKEGQDGALQRLEKLQERAERLAAEKEAQMKEKKEMSLLKKKVQQLKKKKNQLSQQLKHDEHEMLHEYMDNADDDTYIDKLTEQEKEVILNSVYVLQSKKLRDICDAYGLAGVSIESENQSTINFRLDTSFNGQYHTPYFVQIQSGNLLKVARHTIPYFIPFTTIEHEHLNSNIQSFFRELLSYLNAFVARRKQVNLLKEENQEELIGEVSCSPAFDLVEFTYKIQDREASVRIKMDYGSLTNILPTNVLFNIQDDDDILKDNLHKKIDSFKFHLIHKAVKELFT